MAWSDTCLLETWPTRGACSFISECCSLPLKPSWLLYILHNSYFEQGNWYAEQCVCLAIEKEAKLKVCWPHDQKQLKFFVGPMHWAAHCRASLHPCCMCRCEILNGRRAAKLLWRTNIGWNCKLIKMNSSLILLDQKNSWKSKKSKFLYLQIFCFLEQPCSHKSFVLSPRGSFPGCKIRAFFFLFFFD